MEKNTKVNRRRSINLEIYWNEKGGIRPTTIYWPLTPDQPDIVQRYRRRIVQKVLDQQPMANREVGGAGTRYVLLDSYGEIMIVWREEEIWFIQEEMPE